MQKLATAPWITTTASKRALTRRPHRGAALRSPTRGRGIREARELTRARPRCAPAPAGEAAPRARSSASRSPTTLLAHGSASSPVRSEALLRRAAPNLFVRPGESSCTTSSLEIVAAPCRSNAASASLFPAPRPPVTGPAIGLDALLSLVGGAGGSPSESPGPCSSGATASASMLASATSADTSWPSISSRRRPP